MGELRQYWAEGLSASEIATAMGIPTRNAIIGKAHRLGLPLRGASTKPRKKPSRTRPKHGWRDARWANGREPKFGAGRPPKVTKQAPDEPAPLIYPEPALVSWHALEAHHCRFIPGDPAGEHTLYCGCKAVAGQPYCEAHLRRLLNVVQPTKPPMAWRDMPVRTGISRRQALALVR